MSAGEATQYYPCKKCKCPDYVIVDDMGRRTRIKCKCCGKEREMSESISKLGKRPAD